MFKLIAGMIVGAAITIGGIAFAVTGQVPVNGFQVPDGTWLLGLASGRNYSYQYGIVAHAGGTQAACTVLPAGIFAMSVDTVASSNDSVCLPFAVAGTDIQIANNSGNTLGLYGQAANNPLTGAADTINNVAGSTNYAPTTQQNVECMAINNGAWRCMKGS